MVELIQFAVSLIAILALAWLVGQLRLGAAPTIRDEEHVAQIANGIVYGFSVQDAAIGRGGGAAIARDDRQRVMLIFTHGSKFAGRLLSAEAEVRLNQNMLEITPADSAIGTIRLELRERMAQEWAASLRRLNTSAAEIIRA